VAGAEKISDALKMHASLVGEQHCAGCGVARIRAIPRPTRAEIPREFRYLILNWRFVRGLPLRQNAEVIEGLQDLVDVIRQRVEHDSRSCCRGRRGTHQ
jgi:hypothetical protein